jgi:hypothetical protein
MVIIFDMYNISVSLPGDPTIILKLESYTRLVLPGGTTDRIDRVSST